MNKKLIFGGGAVVIIAIIAYMVFTGGGATEDDLKQGAETEKALDDKLANPEDIEMPETDTDVEEVELDEFDPNDI